MSATCEVTSPLKPQSAGADRASAVPGWRRAIPALAICLALVRSRERAIGWPLPLYDFMTYWAAGRLFLSGANPYSASAMYAIERHLGWQYTQPLVLLNPPWVLPFIAPLGALPFNVAHCLWWALSMATEVVCALALWRYFGGDPGKRWMAIVLVLTFFPGGAAERMGQITPLMLGAVAAFLLFVRERRYTMAGLCLIGFGMKPHLLYLVVLAVVLWTVESRRWSLAVAAVSTYAIATLGAIAFNHQVLGYFHGTTQAALDTSCGVGGALRSLFGMQFVWLQFLPTLVGAAWLVFYWRKHRNAWKWEERIPMLLLVSVATAPYSWNHDYILVLPAFVSLVVTISRTRTDWLVPCAFYLVLQIVVFNEVELFSKAWAAASSLLWLVLYIGLKRYFSETTRTETPAGDGLPSAFAVPATPSTL